jgi:gluconolactonase
MERIAEGYVLAEAPVALDGGGLLFSDVLGGGIYRWTPGADGVETVVPKKRGVGGMALHAEGGFVTSGRELRHFPPEGGPGEVLHTVEESVVGVNDITVDADGRLVIGTLRFRPFTEEKPVPAEFVRVEADGSTSVVLPGVLWCNGCGFSPDGGTFYGADYHRGIVLAADRDGDDGFREPRVAVESPSGEADGMAVDEEGALWVALGRRASVGRFRPDGALDQEIDVPASFVASLCFGGADGRDLFITTAGDEQNPQAGAVFVTRAPVAGAPVPPVSAYPAG